MLLSRLKNRNKTVPTIDSHMETKSANRQEPPLVSRNTWTAAELETVLPPPDAPELTDHTPNSSPSLEQRHKDIIKILPELPRAKGIKLPPIKREH